MFTAWATPGTVSAISAARSHLVGARKRRARRKLGHDDEDSRRSSCGMKPMGVLRNSFRPKARMPA